MTKALSFFVLLLFSVAVLSQDTYELKSGDPIWNSTKEKYMFPVDSFNEYFLDFNVSELSGISLLWVELSRINEDGQSFLILHERYKVQELIQHYKTGDIIKISFGNLEIGGYAVSVQTEGPGKKIGSKKTKTNSQ